MNIFQEAEQITSRPVSRRRDPNISSLDLPERQAAGYSRPQSAKFSLGDSTNQLEITTGRKIVGGMSKSHFSLSGEDVASISPPMHKRNVNSHSNDSHFSIAGSDEILEPHFTRKLVIENPNGLVRLIKASHWDVSSGGMQEQTFVPARKMHFDNPESQAPQEATYFSGKRLVQQESNSSNVPLAVFEKPSSRVLAPPGGLTSVFIG